MLLKFDTKRNRILLSVAILIVVGIITSVVTFSNTYDWVETDVDKLYKKLLLQNDELINSDTYLVTDEYISRISVRLTAKTEQMIKELQ